LVRYQHSQAIRAKLRELYPSAATANRHLYALKGVLKEAWRLGYMSAEDYQRAVDIKRIDGEKAASAERGRALRGGELAALIGVCSDDTARGARDAAIIAVAYGAGLRRAEIAGLDLADYDGDKCQIVIRAGKGNKERVIPMNEGVCAAINDWLELRGPWAGPIFTKVYKGGHVSTEGLTAQTIYDMMAERADQAGVKHFSPHDMRRSFAGDLLDAGADLVTVQKLMGHSDPRTTSGYDRRDGKNKRAAIDKLHVPYYGKK
jgi:integrase